MIFTFFIHLVVSIATAAPCEKPFPLHTDEGIVSACLKPERLRRVGHLLFAEFPKGIYSTETSSGVMYFDNNAKTRQRLCKLLQMKRQVSDYTLADTEGSGITYGRYGFEINKKATTLKMLACSQL